jgi:glycosyltransferase involved in cell wall biosynthesis
MACAKPLLVCSGEKTPICNFLENKNCAFLITEKNIEKKVQTMADILRNHTKEDLSSKGQNGLGYIATDYSKSAVTDRYVDLINNLGH